MPKKQAYTALVGFNYGPKDVRVEPGETVDNLPEAVAADLLDQGAIVPATEG